MRGDQIEIEGKKFYVKKRQNPYRDDRGKNKELLSGKEYDEQE